MVVRNVGMNAELSLHLVLAFNDVRDMSQKVSTFVFETFYDNFVFNLQIKYRVNFVFFVVCLV